MHAASLVGEHVGIDGDVSGVAAQPYVAAGVEVAVDISAAVAQEHQVAQAQPCIQGNILEIAEAQATVQGTESSLVVRYAEAVEEYAIVFQMEGPAELVVDSGVFHLQFAVLHPCSVAGQDEAVQAAFGAELPVERAAQFADGIRDDGGEERKL